MFARIYENYFDPADPRLRKLRMQQLVLGAKNTIAVGPGFAATIAVAATLNTLWSPALLCALWALAIFAARAVTLRCATEIAAHATEYERLAEFAVRLVLSTSTTVTLVASGSLLLWAPDVPANHMFWGLVCGAGAILVAAQAAPFLPHGATSMIYVAVFAAAAMSQGTPEYFGIGGVALCCGIYVFGILKSLNALGTQTLTLSQEKDALVDQLLQASQAKSDFLANMSHELRTPLNAVIGFSDVMRQETFGPLGAKQYHSYADDIHMSGQHLLSLINDILDLSKIEAGRFELRDETIDLADLARDAVRLVAPRAQDGGVTIVNATQTGLVMRGDERALKQCLVNLLSNAVKFTPQGGEVRIRADRRDDGLWLHVSDTGCGIHPDDQAKVFESFGQGRHAAASSERGTGLGLPIVKGLVQAHGGAVALSSEVGKGTTVSILLPVSRLAATASASAAA